MSLTLVSTSCQTAYQKMEPIITCPLPTSRISTFPSAFLPLSNEEKKEEWGKEMVMGDVFARECDLYRAITCYKRALILLPADLIERRLQCDYSIILSYYLGNKYQEAVNIFESSDLSQSDPNFPAFNNLLLMMYECYLQVGKEDKANCILQAIDKFSPESASDLLLYQTLKSGEIESARCVASYHRESEEIERDFAFYDQFAKSPKLAKSLNAILPGAGYYYLGQRRSALTSFIINALFTAASYQFFKRGYPAAGAITFSLELGWYLGGINGAGLEAREFNTRLYENVGRKILIDHDCFPLLMFETIF